MIQSVDFVETFRAFVRDGGLAADNLSLANNDELKISAKFTQEKYFSLSTIPEGLTFIRSPKGSGKTSSLLDVMEPLLTRIRFASLEKYEEADDDGLYNEDTNFRVLLIGHRQALIRDLCKRLKLNCYLDDSDLQHKYGQFSKQRYGVCLDSLRKVQHIRYDLIIIDEVEQVLAHFLSDTLRDREYIFKLLSALIVSTPKVIALDADLDWTAFDTLIGMKLKYQDRFDHPLNANVFVNEFFPENRSLKIFNSKSHLLGELHSDIRSGKRCFISSNSKVLVKQINDIICEEFQEHKRVICITSENSHNDAIQHFITHVKTEAKHYDVILSSPSLGTGIDITFENDETGIDVVYGFFEALINTHTDIDQQMGRVRHPGDVKLWITHRQFQFETNLDVVTSDLCDDHFLVASCIDIDPFTRLETFDTNNPFLIMAASITSSQRRSKNNLKKNYISYKRRLGWKIELVEKDIDVISTVSSAFKAAKNRLLQHHIQQVIDCNPLQRDDFFEIRDRLNENDSVNPSEFLSFTRTSIEQFYCQPLSSGLIELDKVWSFRRAVRFYELLTNEQRLRDEFPDHERMLLPTGKIKFKLLRDFMGATFLLRAILNALPFYINGSFDTSIEFTATDLSKFASFCWENKAYIEALLGEEVRSDVGDNPTQQLGRILKLLGIEHKKTRSSKLDGVRKIYHYKINQESIDHMNEIVNHRDKFRDDPWRFVHELHGFAVPEEILVDPNKVDGESASIHLELHLQAIHRPAFPRIPSDSRG